MAIPEAASTPKLADQAADSQVLVARQPILDRSRRLYGYELLFRPSATATAAGTTGEIASARVITGAVSAFGLDTLTGGHRAFINITRQLLLSGVPAVLPPNRVVLELLEDIEADDEVVEACRRLRSAGYTIALDDFTLNDRTAGLIPVADVIKVDYLQTPAAEAQALMAAARGARRIMMLAEKIETVEQFEQASSAGYDYFQGYFFGRPVTSSRKSVPGHQLGYLRLLRALYDPDITLQQIENLIKHEASLCLRVLQTVNSAGYAQYSEVDSIGRALLLLGRDVVCRWTALWILAGVGKSSHPELLVMSTVRARCCETLSVATRGPQHASEGFLMGICSLLDAILESPMPEILAHLPLSDATKAALRGEDTPQRRLLDCVIAYEKGDWETSLRMTQQAGIDIDVLKRAHYDALVWARELDVAATS